MGLIEVNEPIFPDGFLDMLHKIHIIREVVNGIESRRENLIGKVKVPEISPRIMTTAVARAGLIDWFLVFCVLGLFDGHLSRCDSSVYF